MPLSLHHGATASIHMSRDGLCRLLQACIERKDLGFGRQLYDHLLKIELDSISLFADHLIRLFTSCGSLLEANAVFLKVPHPSVYTWNAILEAHVKLENPHRALMLYEKMHLQPDKITFLWVLKACACVGGLIQGRHILKKILSIDLISDLMLGNTLIDMFAKCGSPAEAHEVFDQLPSRDVVSWGALMTGYLQHGQESHVLSLFERMQLEGVHPDRVILLCIVQACGIVNNMPQGQVTHHQAVLTGYEIEVVLGSAIVDMYAKCMCMDEARAQFDKLPKHNIVSWGAVIGGFSNQGHDLTVLELYEQMQEEGLLADKVIFLCVFKACSSTDALMLGRLVDENVRESTVEIEVVLGSSIIEMYAKCGSLEDAFRVLMGLPNRNAVAWGVMIDGYVTCGDQKMVNQCLQLMQKEGLALDHLICTCILTSCSHVGLLKDGCDFFNSMIMEHGIMPGIEQYACMIDLLCRVGCLTEARFLLETMPLPPDSIVWRSLLTGCKVYGHVEAGRQCLDQLQKSDCSDAAAYMLMSDIYTAANMWEDAEFLQEVRFCANAPKKLGRAWIQINNVLHEFVVRDKIILLSDKISSKVSEIGRLTKQQGYMPQVGLVLELMGQDVT